ncbi:MAG: transcription antitermination factor NusB [Thalassobaculales bacterium]
MEPNPRALAVSLMRAVMDQHRALDEAMAGDARLAALDPRDRAFCRTLVATTLRRLGQIDALLKGHLRRPLPARAAPVRQALRLGAAQLLFLGLPAHAAVGETVGVVEGLGFAGLKGLANAVLRRLADDGPAALAAQDAPRLALPGWLWGRWVAAYGEATTRAIAAALLEEPPLDISVKGDAPAWAARLGAVVLPTGSLRRPLGGRIEDLPGYAEGEWWVQDAAATLPARLLGEVRGRDLIDLCAAPGGKTAQLAAAGARVIAVDRSEPRLARLQANLRRLGLPARAVAADAGTWQPPAPADAVLLDAPCSATGTLRRHPDVAHLKRPEDIGRLAALQARLLRNALAMLRPGGTLVYCVCSLEPEEGPGVVEAALAEGIAQRLPVAAGEIGGLAECLTPAGDLRTLPCHLAAAGGLDGFYAARLRRPG